MSISTGLPSSDALRALRQIPSADFKTLLYCAMLPSIGPDLFKEIRPDADWSTFSALVYALDLGVPTGMGELKILPTIATSATEEALSRGMDLMQVHREVGQALETLGSPLEALRQFVMARDNVGISRLLERHSSAWAVDGHFDEILKAHKIIGGDPRATGGIGLLDSAWASISQGEIQRARAQLGLARELLGPRIAKEARAALDLADGFVAYESGDFTLAGQCAERVLRALDVQDEQLLPAFWLKGLSGFRMRDEALTAATAAEAAQRVPATDLSAVMTKRALDAMAHAVQGEPLLALEAADGVLLALEQVVPQRHFYPMDAWLIRIWSLRSLGREEEALAALAAEASHLEENDSPLARIEWLRMSAELALDRGDEARARADLKALREIVDRSFSLHEAMPLADQLEATLRVRLGDFTRAAALAARGPAGARRELIQVQVLAQSRPDLALARLRSIRSQASDQMLLMDVLLADLHRRLNNPREAEAALVRAFTAAGSQGLVAPLVYAPLDLAPLLLQVAAMRGDAFADRVASRLVTRLEGRAGATPAAEAVTERELSIMRMLASGLSLEQVAAHLSISTATVKSHATHVARKLGVRSRTEAIAQLRDKGLV